VNVKGTFRFAFGVVASKPWRARIDLARRARASAERLLGHLDGAGRPCRLTGFPIQFHHQEGLGLIVEACFSPLPRSFFDIPCKSRYIISGEMLRFHRSAAPIERTAFSNKKRVGCSSTWVRFFAIMCA